MKRYLFVWSRPPHQGCFAQEALDIVLTTAAFDQAVSLLLLDAGLLQIKKGQHPEQLALKNTSVMFDALALYDIHDVYVELESLQEYGFTVNDLSLPVQTLPRAAVSDFMSGFDVIFPV